MGRATLTRHTERETLKLKMNFSFYYFAFMLGLITKLGMVEAMRYNSLRVRHGDGEMEDMDPPLEGMPLNLREINLKQLEQLTSILTDLTKNPHKDLIML